METPLFKNILFPVQFDRITIPALEMLTHLARQSERFVYLLCVIPEDVPDIRQLADDAPVSYTHLDVYKRQSRFSHRSHRENRAAPPLPRKNAGEEALKNRARLRPTLKRFNYSSMPVVRWVCDRSSGEIQNAF